MRSPLSVHNLSASISYSVVSSRAVAWPHLFLPDISLLRCAPPQVGFPLAIASIFSPHSSLAFFPGADSTRELLPLPFLPAFSHAILPAFIPNVIDQSAADRVFKHGSTSSVARLSFSTYSAAFFGQLCPTGVFFLSRTLEPLHRSPAQKGRPAGWSRENDPSNST